MQKIFMGLVIFLAIFTCNAIEEKKPTILITTRKSPYLCGIETHMFNVHKSLLGHGYNSHLLTYPDTLLTQRLIKAEIPHHAYASENPTEHDKAVMIRLLCEQHAVDIIMCNTPEYVPICQRAIHGMNTKVIFFDHMHAYFNVSRKKSSRFKDLDAVIAVGHDTLKLYKDINVKARLGIKHIEHCAPFFDQDTFISYLPEHNTKQQFFKARFGLTLSDAPLVCMIANAYPNPRKNHRLLLQAVEHLIKVKNKRLEVVFVGSGSDLPNLKNIAQARGIEQSVHFLGKSYDVPSILYHSDMHVLTSVAESFGLVHLEAAMMRKPSIGTSGTGAEQVIMHEKTGLLFKNNNVDDLVDKLNLLLSDSKLRTFFGDNAYTYVIENFSHDVLIKRLSTIFDMVLR